MHMLKNEEVYTKVCALELSFNLIDFWLVLRTASYRHCKENSVFKCMLHETTEVAVFKVQGCFLPLFMCKPDTRQFVKNTIVLFSLHSYTWQIQSLRWVVVRYSPPHFFAEHGWLASSSLFLQQAAGGMAAFPRTVVLLCFCILFQKRPEGWWGTESTDCSLRESRIQNAHTQFLHLAVTAAPWDHCPLAAEQHLLGIVQEMRKKWFRLKKSDNTE